MRERNYLFAANADDVALTRLIATAAKATGFMKGAPGGPLPGWYQQGEDNRGFLETTYARIAQAYPEAGQPYYAARLWNGLTWQPVYLATLSVHLHGAVPDVTRMAQSRQNLDIDGYRLQPGPMMSGSVEEMITYAGQMLRTLCNAMLAEFITVTRLKRLPAQRLVADRVIEVMARLRHFRPDITLDAQLRYCALWLEATGLTGQGRLEVVDLANGQQIAIRARKGCCLDYLAFPDRYCASCPKQDDAVRVARQKADALAELEA